MHIFNCVPPASSQQYHNQKGNPGLFIVCYDTALKYSIVSLTLATTLTLKLVVALSSRPQHDIEIFYSLAYYFARGDFHVQYEALADCPVELRQAIADSESEQQFPICAYRKYTRLWRLSWFSFILSCSLTTTSLNYQTR